MSGSRTLTVAINRDDVHAIAPETTRFETAGDFSVELDNGGQATHVHLHLDDELATVARIRDGNNHFVEAEKSVLVPVTVEDGRRPVTGRMKLVTGYGAETRYVEVSVIEEEEPDTGVRVDESLGVKRAPEPAPTSPGISVGTVALVALALLALVLAGGVALLAGGPAVAVGAAVVLLAVIVALYLVLT